MKQWFHRITTSHAFFSFNKELVKHREKERSLTRCNGLIDDIFAMGSEQSIEQKSLEDIVVQTSMLPRLKETYTLCALCELQRKQQI